MNRITKKEALQMMNGSDSHVRFVLNWSLMQCGWVTTKVVAELIKAGHEVTVAQFGNGFFVNGKHVTKEILDKGISSMV